MGALPKRKISKTRRRNRRAHYLKIDMPHFVRCTTCQALHLSHHVCHKCGTYDGVQVIEPKDKTRGII